MAQAVIGIVLIMQNPELQAAQFDKTVNDTSTRKPCDGRKWTRSALVSPVALAADLSPPYID